MIAFITLCYASFYVLIFNKMQWLEKTTANISAFVGVGIVLIASIVFMWQTFAPISADARMFRYVIPIVPTVKGHVVDVPIKPIEAVNKGDVLFQIDPTPYEHTVMQLEGNLEKYQADKELAQLNLDRAKRLLKTQSAAQVDIDRWTASLASAEGAIKSTTAQLNNARWELQRTTVTAPHDGFVAGLQVRPGSFVSAVQAGSPMAFVSTETSELIASYSQSASRRIAVGNSVEVQFTSIPGEVYSGTVTTLAKVSSQAQLNASGQLPALTGAPANDRWVVRVELDDVEFAKTLPQGAGGTMAVYTNAGKPLHIISKVVLRINAWTGFLTSP